MMMLRMMMLRGKPIPRPQQPFCASRRSRNALGHSQATMYGNLQVKCRRPNPGGHTLCKPAQSKCTRTCHNSHPVQKFTRKRPKAKTAPHVLCKHAQSKSSWPCHKSHLLRKCTSKRPQAKSTPNSLRTFCASLRNRNAHGNGTKAISCGNFLGNAAEHLDQAPALTPTVRTPLPILTRP